MRYALIHNVVVSLTRRVHISSLQTKLQSQQGARIRTEYQVTTCATRYVDEIHQFSYCRSSRVLCIALSIAYYQQSIHALSAALYDWADLSHEEWYERFGGKLSFSKLGDRKLRGGAKPSHDNADMVAKPVTEPIQDISMDVWPAEERNLQGGGPINPCLPVPTYIPPTPSPGVMSMWVDYTTVMHPSGVPYIRPSTAMNGVCYTSNCEWTTSIRCHHLHAPRNQIL
jgi:hypothetical protein